MCQDLINTNSNLHGIWFPPSSYDRSGVYNRSMMMMMIINRHPSHILHLNLFDPLTNLSFNFVSSLSGDDAEQKTFLLVPGVLQHQILLNTLPPVYEGRSNVNLFHHPEVKSQHIDAQQINPFSKSPQDYVSIVFVSDHGEAYEITYGDSHS